MSRNALYLVIGVLLVVVIGFGVYAETRPGIEVRVDDQGISIDGNG